jgi:hypothetical protein
MPEKDTSLKDEFDFYLKNQQELVEQYDGRFIVIKDRKVIGAYASEAEAIRETTRLHKLGTFLVQECRTGTDTYTQVFHSRVTFV